MKLLHLTLMLFVAMFANQTIDTRDSSVSFSEQMQIMNSQEEQGLVYHYTRINEFPE